MNVFHLLTTWVLGSNRNYVWSLFFFLRDREASEIPGKMRDDTQTYEPSKIPRHVTLPPPSSHKKKTFRVTIVSNFFWVLLSSLKILKTMLMKHFWGKQGVSWAGAFVLSSCLCKSFKQLWPVIALFWSRTPSEQRKHQFLLTLFYSLAFFLLSIPNKNLLKMCVRVVESLS